MISIIVAVADNYAIGKDNQLLYNHKRIFNEIIHK